MGLPLWREPEKNSSKKEAATRAAAPPQACDRVNTGGIDRRRVYSNRHRSARREFRRPRLDLLASQYRDNAPTAGFHDWAQESASPQQNGVPSVSNLFEVANRQENARLEAMDAAREAAERAYPQWASQNQYTSHDLRFQAAAAQANMTPAQHQQRVAILHDRMRLMQHTTRAVSNLRHEDTIATPTVPMPPAFSPPSPSTSNRRLRRARALTASDDHAVRILSTPVDGPGERALDVDETNGLGDRDRSPTPSETWEIMRSTIQPDTTLPSEESSFTTAIASQTYQSSLSSTVITEDLDTASSQDREQASNEESASSVDTDACEEEADVDTTPLAREMYFRELESPEGRERIAMHQELRDREGNRFATPDEAPSVDIGFRLIEAALERVEERHRSLRLRGQHSSTAEYGPDLTRLSSIIEADRARQLQEATVSQDAPEAQPVGSSAALPQSQDAGLVVAQALRSTSQFSDDWLSSMGMSGRRNRVLLSRDARSEAALNGARGSRIERHTQTRRS